MTWLLVAVGAALGAPLRYLTDRAVQRWLGTSYAWGTLSVNILGTFLLGVLVGLGSDHLWSMLLATGFCGAYTTYSAFAYETVELARSRRGTLAAAGAALTLGLGLVAVTVGLWCGRSL